MLCDYCVEHLQQVERYSSPPCLRVQDTPLAAFLIPAILIGMATVETDQLTSRMTIAHYVAQFSTVFGARVCLVDCQLFCRHL